MTKFELEKNILLIELSIKNKITEIFFKKEVFFKTCLNKKGLNSFNLSREYLKKTKEKKDNFLEKINIFEHKLQNFYSDSFKENLEKYENWLMNKSKDYENYIKNNFHKNLEIKKSKIVIEFKLSKIINRLEKYPIKKQKESIRLKLGLISLEDYIHFYEEYTNLEIEKITLEKELKILLLEESFRDLEMS